MVSTTDMSQCNNVSASNNAPMLAMPTIIEDVLLTSHFGVVMDGENVYNVEHVGASTSATLNTPLLPIPAEFAAADKFIDDLLVEYRNGETAESTLASNIRVRNEAETPGSALSAHEGIEAEAAVDNVNEEVPAANSEENSVLEIPGSVLKVHVDTETEIGIPNQEGSKSVAEVEDSISSPRVLVSNLTHLPTGDGYDSGEDFQSVQPKKKVRSASSTSSCRTLTKVPQMGVGSSGKRVPQQQQQRQQKNLRHQVRSDPNTGNDECPILRKYLAAEKTLPAKGRTSAPKRQLKRPVATSMRPAGNTSPRPGCSGMVLPEATRNVVRAPIVHVIESDGESEVFSQTTENILSEYHSLCDRVRREYSENLSKVQRSEESFRRADEAFRRAKEGRLVALNALQRDQRALEQSSKKLGRIDQR